MNDELNKFDEKTCELICRNCAVAFKLPALVFYETDAYVEITYKIFSIAMMNKDVMMNKDCYQVWHLLLWQMLSTLGVYKYLVKYTQVKYAQELKDFSPSIEQALVNIDLNASEIMKDEVA